LSLNRRPPQKRLAILAGQLSFGGLSLIATKQPERRPGLNALMVDARRGVFDLVVIWRFDRFSSQRHSLLLAMEDLRIHFISHQEALGTSTPMGRVMYTIIAANGRTGTRRNHGTDHC
jgi:hypothetical protein